MTKLNLDEIEARAKAASKGPLYSKKDIRFIDEARTDVPMLVECIRELAEALRGIHIPEAQASRNISDLLKKWGLE